MFSFFSSSDDPDDYEKSSTSPWKALTDLKVNQNQEINYFKIINFILKAKGFKDEAVNFRSQVVSLR